MALIGMNQEVWADENGKAVPYGDTRGRTVLFGVGQHISEADAKKHGITSDGVLQTQKKAGEVTETSAATEVTATDPTPATKAIETAPANKSIQRAERKK